MGSEQTTNNPLSDCYRLDAIQRPDGSFHVSLVEPMAGNQYPMIAAALLQLALQLHQTSQPASDTNVAPHNA